MSRSLQRIVGPILAAAVLGAAAFARADEPPAATSPDQSTAPKTEAGAAPAAAPQPAPAAAPAAAPSAGANGAPLYRVVDGNHVDHNTLEGWHTWRALACERCHGANQEGLVGPSLVDDLKTMSREDFNKCVLEGRVDKGMPNFGGIKTVVDNLNNLYAFLKGRSDGAVPTGHLKEIQ